MENQIELKFKLNFLSQLCQDFCEKNTELYEVTCDEYIHLLASDIDNLEQAIDKKTEVLEFINKLETQRNEATSELASHYNIEKPKKLQSLLEALRANNEEKTALQIEKLNMILLDIVEKIQEQNKKNQFFLNKAIYSLKELKDSFTGKPTYKTYSSSGMTRSKNSY
jgi:flagellar biosynthesis/type III secretory pathway chaperone